MHFGENQLSRSLIGLSPTTAHPLSLQPEVGSGLHTVLPALHPGHGRSPASGPEHTTALDALFRLLSLRLPHLVNLATHPDSQAHSSTPSPHNKVEGSDGIVSTRFQVLFHSPRVLFSPFPHGTCPLSVTGSI